MLASPKSSREGEGGKKSSLQFDQLVRGLMNFDVRGGTGKSGERGSRRAGNGKKGRRKLGKGANEKGK